MMPKMRREPITELVRQYGGHLENRAREFLALLPDGWVGLVRGMLDRVEQILAEDEQRTFRWTDIRSQGGALQVSWFGASSSEGLIDQIAEEAVVEAAATCIECGEPALPGVTKRRDPRCPQHSLTRMRDDQTAQGEVASAHLIRTLQETLGTLRMGSPSAYAKTVAATLPFMMDQAGGYFRAPDRDVQAITHQLQEALRCLDSVIRTYVHLSLVPYER